MKKILLLLSLCLLLGNTPLLAADIPTMSKEELRDKLGSADITILDVRSGRDWSSSEFKIQGAVRASASDFANWSKRLAKDQTLVLYCA